MVYAYCNIPAVLPPVDLMPNLRSMVHAACLISGHPSFLLRKQEIVIIPVRISNHGIQLPDQIAVRHVSLPEPVSLGALYTFDVNFPSCIVINVYPCIGSCHGMFHVCPQVLHNAPYLVADQLLYVPVGPVFKIQQVRIGASVFPCPGRHIHSPGGIGNTSVLLTIVFLRNHSHNLFG